MFISWYKLQQQEKYNCSMGALYGHFIYMYDMLMITQIILRDFRREKNKIDNYVLWRWYCKMMLFLNFYIWGYEKIRSSLYHQPTTGVHFVIFCKIVQ